MVLISITLDFYYGETYNKASFILKQKGKLFMSNKSIVAIVMAAALTFTGCQTGPAKNPITTVAVEEDKNGQTIDQRYPSMYEEYDSKQKDVIKEENQHIIKKMIPCQELTGYNGNSREYNLKNLVNTTYSWDVCLGYEVIGVELIETSERSEITGPEYICLTMRNTVKVKARCTQNPFTGKWDYREPGQAITQDGEYTYYLPKDKRWPNQHIVFVPFKFGGRYPNRPAYQHESASIENTIDGYRIVGNMHYPSREAGESFDIYVFENNDKVVLTEGQENRFGTPVAKEMVITKK